MGRLIDSDDAYRRIRQHMSDDMAKRIIENCKGPSEVVLPKSHVLMVINDALKRDCFKDYAQYDYLYTCIDTMSPNDTNPH
jgi:hypothetical protein